MIVVTAAQLRAAAPSADPNVAAAIAATSGAAFARWKITTLRQVWGFFSTAIEETGLRNLVEDMNYTAERAHEMWPSMLPSVAAAAPYAGQPEKLADKVYGSRMGNEAGTNDGYNFRGHGLPQVTGRDNFTALAKLTGLDTVNHPELTTDPAHMLDCALAIFTENPIVQRYCDSADWRALWAIIGSGRANGPIVNLSNHEAALAAVQKAIPKLADAPAPAAAAAPSAQAPPEQRLADIKVALAVKATTLHPSWLDKLEALIAEL